MSGEMHVHSVTLQNSVQIDCENKKIKENKKREHYHRLSYVSIMHVAVSHQDRAYLFVSFILLTFIINGTQTTSFFKEVVDSR